MEDQIICCYQKIIKKLIKNFIDTQIYGSELYFYKKLKLR